MWHSIVEMISGNPLPAGLLVAIIAGMLLLRARHGIR